MNSNKMARVCKYFRKVFGNKFKYVHIFSKVLPFKNKYIFIPYVFIRGIT